MRFGDPAAEAKSLGHVTWRTSLARKRSKNFDSIASLVNGFLAEFQAETDRGTTVVGAAFLNDILATMLRKHFVDDPNVVHDLLDFQGPLGTFSSRINLTYSLGLIRNDQFEDLNTVRKIRNAFAHSHQPLSFERPRVCDLRDNLSQIAIIEQFRDQMSAKEREILIDKYNTQRERFIGNAVHLAVGLMIRGAELTHVEAGSAVQSGSTKLWFEKSGA